MWRSLFELYVFSEYGASVRSSMAGSTTLLQLLSVAVTRQRCLMSVVVGILSTLRGLWRTCTVDHEPYVGSGLWRGNANGQRRESESRERRTVRRPQCARARRCGLRRPGPGAPGRGAGGAPQNPNMTVRVPYGRTAQKSRSQSSIAHVACVRSPCVSGSCRRRSCPHENEP